MSMPTVTKRAKAPLPTRRRNTLPARRHGRLKPGRTWESWEKLRVGGQSELAALKPGEIGVLHTKTGTFRIVREDDFQTLYGQARDAERLSGGFSLMVTAARAVSKHRDDTTVNTLVETLTFIGDMPALPVRKRFAPLQPQTLVADDSDDEIELDASVIRRAIAKAEQP
jgi:hypothetical protein